jgi:hypothetical protein
LPPKSARDIILTMNIKESKNIPFGLIECAPELLTIFGRLEDGRETHQSKRVGRVLELLSGLGENPRGINAANLISELNPLLGHYRWTTHALVSRTPEGYRAVFRQRPEGNNLSREDAWEYEAVANLLDITRYPGALARLRQCGNQECRRWLFTPKGKTRQFCNNLCKQRRFDSDPEQREKKRNKMRENYADEKRRKLNPKCGVGLRRTK